MIEIPDPTLLGYNFVMGSSSTSTSVSPGDLESCKARCCMLEYYIYALDLNKVKLKAQPNLEEISHT